MLETSNFIHRSAMQSPCSCDEWVFPKWAWSGSREQFLHCGLRKFRHSKSSVYRWYPQLDRRRFVYDTYKTMKATRTRHGWVHMFTTHRPSGPTLTLRFVQDLSYYTVAWQLAKFQLTRRIARSLGDSWASCLIKFPVIYHQFPVCCWVMSIMSYADWVTNIPVSSQ